MAARLKSARFALATRSRCWLRSNVRVLSQSSAAFSDQKKHFSEQEIAFFLNIDFERHVALVAQIEEDDGAAIVGGGRYIMVTPARPR
jgi:hypothetical protein